MLGEATMHAAPPGGADAPLPGRSNGRPAFLNARPDPLIPRRPVSCGAAEGEDE